MIFCADAAAQKEIYLQKAKEEFQKEFELQNYDSAAFYLKKARELDSHDQEIRYWLGYAIERSVSKDARGMINHTWKDVKEASDEFQEVIRIDSTYRGESIVLDPYSKLTSLWGSLAFSYLHKNKRDSALIALKHGKEIGGFSDPLLELVRNMLKTCSEEAILLFTGDNYTFPVLYLQLTENYRTDVHAMDLGLLNTAWYLHYLMRENRLELSFPVEKLDSLEMEEWKAKEIEVVVSPPADINYTPESPFRFMLKPTVYDYYLNRSDYVLLDVLQQNRFRKNIYFAYGTNPVLQLGLTPYLYNAGLADLLVPYSVTRYASGAGTLQVMERDYDFKSLYASRSFVAHSNDLRLMLGNYRYILGNHIVYQLKQENEETARRLFNFHSKRLPAEILPYASKEMEDFFTRIGKQFD